jgi:outer membrane protein OmpA-like peptidoglycan-associated protein
VFALCAGILGCAGPAEQAGPDPEAPSPDAAAALAALEPDLARALEASDGVEVSEVRRAAAELLQVVIPNELLFPFGQTDIEPSGAKILDSIAQILVAHRDVTVRIVGHTDSIGSAGYNQYLTEQQAGAVRSRLVAHGLPAARVAAEGRGESEPRADNATETGRRLNRRVELLIFPATGDAARIEGGQVPQGAGR